MINKVVPKQTIEVETLTPKDDILIGDNIDSQQKISFEKQEENKIDQEIKSEDSIDKIQEEIKEENVEKQNIDQAEKLPTIEPAQVEEWREPTDQEIGKLWDD